MSGYNAKTGRFDLTWTKASDWWRDRTQDRDPMPSEMQHFASELRRAGINVYSVHSAWMSCEHNPAAIYKALAGKTMQASRAKYYANGVSPQQAEMIACKAKQKRPIASGRPIPGDY